MASPPSSRIMLGPPAVGPAQGRLGAPPVLLEGLALPGVHRDAGGGDGRGGVVLGGEDVARRPAHLGAEGDQGLDQHGGLHGHVQRAGDAGAGQRLRLSPYSARSDMRPGISTSARLISRRPKSARADRRPGRGERRRSARTRGTPWRIAIVGWRVSPRRGERASGATRKAPARPGPSGPSLWSAQTSHYRLGTAAVCGLPSGVLDPSDDLRPPARILMVTAHPDDVDFGAAGSVAAWTAAGAEVTYCVVTDGDAGGFDPSVPRTEIPAIRRAEQTAAAEAVGVSRTWFGSGIPTDGWRPRSTCGVTWPG